MMRESLALIPVSNDYISLYSAFDEAYESELKGFQSRIRPHNFENFIKLTENHLLLWFYLTIQGKVIGSIWLEKENAESSSAVLGIFICDNDFRGQGLGEEAINHILKMSNTLKIGKAELNVRADNLRAINCYKKCGFEDISTLIKKNGINAIHMERTV